MLCLCLCARLGACCCGRGIRRVLRWCFPYLHVVVVIRAETAAWADMYCRGDKCPYNGPWSIWYDPQFDDVFSQSYGALIWPRAAAAAGSYWNYVPSLDPTGAAFQALLSAHNGRLSARGGLTCPNSCYCDWNSA